MSRYFHKIYYALFLLLLHSSGLQIVAEVKCIEKERQALLNFKQSLSDRYGMLSTWKDDDYNSDCCKWNGIQCNNQTGHIQLLDLRGDRDSLNNPRQYLEGQVNLTSLIDLHNIQHLDLSNNYFLGSKISEFIGFFTKLTYLNLSLSYFAGRIPSTFGNLSQLHYLDLRDNLLHGLIPFQIGNLRQLKYLDLSDNLLHGLIPFQIGNLKQLQYLDLVYNDLSGGIPFQAGNLPLLHTLGLGGNFDIKGTDAKWFSNLSSLTSLEFTSFHNLSAFPPLLQTISKLIPNLRVLWLVACSLSDVDIKSLFYSHSNFSTSLTILDLSSNLLTSSTFQLLFNFSLNLQDLYLSQNNIALTSLYPDFPSLKILDLSYNNLTSSIFEGNINFESKLERLYLTNCSLTDRSFIVSSASTMNSSSSLLDLDLSNNLLKSSAIFHWLFNFTTDLHTLCLRGNLLEGPISNGIGKAMNSLENLDLSYNKIQGNILSFFENTCRLKMLDLSNNKLNGEISSFFRNSSWCNRHVFRYLLLDYNQITGRIPKSITLLSELEVLSLEGNRLEGDVTESHLSKFSKLKYLRLSYNSLSLKIFPSWIPPFQLRSLGVASCKLGPSFPGWLQTQSSLVGLDISYNGLNDSVPEWFWNNLHIMYTLNMSHNNFIGEIPNIPLKFHSRPSIILNSNQFEGNVPSFLLQASELLLSENKFSDMSSFLCDQSIVAQLATLDLSNNLIKGQLPDCWKSFEHLLFLDLSNNKLSGKIPISMGTLVKLEALVLGRNSLAGELPSALKNCSNLFKLDVDENLLSGPIPSWIGENMQQLIILILRGNHFSGNVPFQLCSLRHIQLLDLSRNKLSKGIPTCLKSFTAMSEKSINRSEIHSRIYGFNSTYYDIYGLSNVDDYKLDITWMWKGVEQEFPNPELILKSIDLSCNNLTGEIPIEVGYLTGLVSLNLSRNNLSGEIPSEIGNLSSLDSLDLSRNQLSGRIPSSLLQLDGLGKLDLSHNFLSGRIPLGRHFQTYEASSFEGNNDLCGEQLNKSCPGDHTIVKPQESAEHGEDSVFYEALYMSLGIGYFVGFWGLIGPILIWKPWRISYLRFLNRFTNWVTLQ